MKIDLVVTYVDSTNEDWLNNYSNQTETSYPEYFRVNKNALRYLLRGVDSYLPFINQVFLIVQNASEVPDYVDTTKVKVVTHSEFIPEEYLPTFNSNTIESFFGNIENLSEHFLYMNDDWLIINELSESHFYSEDEKAIAYFYLRHFEDGVPSGFDEILIKNNELIWGISREKALSKGYTLCMNHTIRPYFKSLYAECYSKHWDNIAPTLTCFRSSENYNLYMVDSYQNKIDKGINALTVTVGCIFNNDENSRIEAVLSSGVDSLHLHDVDENVDIYENEVFSNFLISTFPVISKYEKEVE